MDTVLILGLTVGLPLSVAYGIFRLVMRHQRQLSLGANARHLELKQREKRAVWTSAKIIVVNQASMMDPQAAHGQARISLRLDVQPPDGAKPYTAHAEWLADMGVMQLLRAGETIAVKIDPEDHKIIYPNISGVEMWVS